MISQSALHGGVAGLLLGVGGAVFALREASPVTPAPAVTPVGVPAAAGPWSFSAIVKRVSPAVVSVAVYDTLDAEAPAAMGSGFFISPDGYVVTNDHVARAGPRLQVTLHDRRRYDARLVGRDPATDLALLKLPLDDAPFVRFSTAAPPQVGDWVVAIGSPYGLGGTATAGIVSAADRDVGRPWVRFLQIDAPINRGNSGGPAFDTAGRVVGVNSGVLEADQGARGIAFAIPASLAAAVVDDLRVHGRVARGHLGATVADVDPLKAERAGLPARGALILDIRPGGPAQAAGLRRGDLIVGLDGAPVAEAIGLQTHLAAAGPGQVVRLDVLRQGQPTAVTLTTGEAPDHVPFAGEKRE